jgi:putative transcriptional regulator
MFASRKDGFGDPCGRQVAGPLHRVAGAARAVSRRTSNALETGRCDPSLALAGRVARYFGSTIEDASVIENG